MGVQISQYKRSGKAGSVPTAECTHFLPPGNSNAGRLALGNENTGASKTLTGLFTAVLFVRAKDWKAQEITG